MKMVTKAVPHSWPLQVSLWDEDGKLSSPALMALAGVTVG